MDATVSKDSSHEGMTPESWMCNAPAAPQIPHIETEISEPLVWFLENHVRMRTVKLWQERREREREREWEEKEREEKKQGKKGEGGGGKEELERMYN